MRDRWCAATFATALVLTATSVFATPSPYGLGTPARPADIAPLDIDVSPDGSGLPRGHGDAASGAEIFRTTCLRCHGSVIRLVPERWAYATSLFDYLRRAMPPDRKPALTADEWYALTAFILATNADISPHDTLDQTSLPRVRMPRVKDFISIP